MSLAKGLHHDLPIFGHVCPAQRRSQEAEESEGLAQSQSGNANMLAEKALDSLPVRSTTWDDPADARSILTDVTARRPWVRRTTSVLPGFAEPIARGEGCRPFYAVHFGRPDPAGEKTCETQEHVQQRYWPKWRVEKCVGGTPCLRKGPSRVRESQLHSR